MQRGQFAPVYFDYDSARIKPSEMSKVEAVANTLKGNTKKLIIEGNTDERGTAEYNRALGERRAGAAREALIRLGIDTSRISTVMALRLLARLSVSLRVLSPRTISTASPRSP